MTPSRRLPGLALLALALGGALLPGAALAERGADLLYVEPNTGSSSGGHLALRLGGRVYHFQNASGDWLRMARVDADWFTYAYSVLQNRGIRVARVAVDEAAFEALRDGLNQRYLIERKHFAVRDGLARDRALLRQMEETQEDRAPEVPLVLRGAGFFDPASPGEAPALARLRDAVRRARGPSALADAGAALRAELAALRPPPEPALAVDAHRYPVPGALFSERFADRALRAHALSTLDRAPPLRAGVLRALPGPAARLGADERRALESFAERLEGRLAELPHSPRPDWGYPMLLGMARLVAIDTSLRSGRWHVLDAFPDDALALSGASVRGRRDFLSELEADAARSLGASRSAFAAREEPGERAYNDIEDTANHWLDTHRGLAEERDIRLAGERLVPEGRGPVPIALLPRGEGLDLPALRERARERAVAFDRALAGAYRYDLLRHNCASELLRALDEALPPGAADALLGGRVDPDAALHFVPLVAFRAALEGYREVRESEIPSYRHARLAEMSASENDVVVALRESNTLSSSIYRRNPRDSFFLFFTDGAVWPRPLLGAANLLAGVGETAWGLLRLPVDGGRRLASGAEGLLFSLPELLFVNLRKGSMEYGPGAFPGTATAEPAAR